jgi:hypothetical protein
MYKRALLLVAAIELQRTHGAQFAVHFLEGFNFHSSVIDELLNNSFAA